MHKVMCIVVFGALGVASVLNYGEAQTVHAVGDTIGWTVPSGAAASYSNWTSGDTFQVGDILGKLTTLLLYKFLMKIYTIALIFFFFYSCFKCWGLICNGKGWGERTKLSTNYLC